MDDHSVVAGQGPVVLVNPPSPHGRTVNREGFGGLGVVTHEAGGFVYPAQRLAEAAGYLKSRDSAVLGLDFVLAERKARKAWKRCAEASHAIVHVSTRSLLDDLNVAATFRGAVAGGKLVVTGVGLESHRDTIKDILGDALIDVGPTGYEAARMVLDADGELGPPDTWPDADWQVLPLAKSRRLPLYHVRGCTHECDYCPYVIATGRDCIVRSPDRTVAEVSAQCRRHRPKRIVFRDPAFGVIPESAFAVLRGIGRLPRDSRAPFEIESRPELISDEMLDLLKEAGCVEIKLGVESLEPEALLKTRRVENPAAVEGYGHHVDRVLAGAAARDIFVRPYMMRGLPGSTAVGDKESAARVARFFPPDFKEVTYAKEGAPRLLG